MRTAPPAPRSEAHTSLPLACSPDDRQLILSLLRDYLDRSAAGRLRTLPRPRVPRIGGSMEPRRISGIVSVTKSVSMHDPLSY